MSHKRWIGAGLAAFAAVGLVVLAAQEVSRSQTAVASNTAAQPSVEQKTYTRVYYFHGTYRCVTCTKLERYTESVLRTEFAAALSDRSVRWQPINVEEPTNAHFVKKYGLFGKSVVLSKVRDGSEVAWRNLDAIWDHVANEASYREYIRSSLRDFLGPSS